MKVDPSRLGRHHRWVKRTVDVAGSLLALVVFLPVMALFSVAIWLSSPGPVIFVQSRTGRDGRVFRCYKFRTMHTLQRVVPLNGPIVTVPDDPRITPVGRMLRKLNLDELPQLVNVLLGDMSLVGPRPIPIAECHHWADRIQGWDLRYRMRPGITGWAQVMGFRGGTLDPEKMEQRLRRDIAYLESVSFGLDLLILAKTVRSMLFLDTRAH